MALRQLIPVVILVLQLHGLTDAIGTLPQLYGNRLAEGSERDLPNASPIICGRSRVSAGRVRTTRSISQALSSYFGSYAFTSGPLGSLQSPHISGIEGRFTFAETKGTNYVYALQVDPSGEHAYWLPQGGFIDIPQHPNAHQPKYVFTPDFSGCSWTVTPMTNGYLRIRHVEGGKEASQFNNKSPAEKGGDVTYAMQYMDYGFMVEMRRLVSNIPAFAYMHYSAGRWTLHFQRKTCASTLGGYVFQRQLLATVTMIDSVQTTYPAISSTREYSIP